MPGAGQTVPLGLNDRGQVAGFYSDEGLLFHGFLREPDGTVTTVDAPDAGGTKVFDVDDRGRLTGLYDDAGHGYMRDRQRRYTRFDAPGVVTETAPFGINRHGEIVGGYDEDLPRHIHGFLRDRRGRFTRIDVPDSRSTTPLDVDDHGQVVGGYLGRAGGFHSFLRDRQGNFTDVEVPDAAVTQVTAVNGDGVMVGNYLAGIVGAPVPFGINDDGQIVGIYTDGRGLRYGFLLDRGRFREIASPGGVFESFPTDIDDQGRIIGYTA